MSYELSLTGEVLPLNLGFHYIKRGVEYSGCVQNPQLQEQSKYKYVWMQRSLLYQIISAKRKSMETEWLEAVKGMVCHKIQSSIYIPSFKLQVCIIMIYMETIILTTFVQQKPFAQFIFQMIYTVDALNNGVLIVQVNTAVQSKH